MDETRPGGLTLRLAEVVATLSRAIDLGLGQPMDHVLRACLVAVRLGETIGLRESELAEVYYLALLCYVGCTAESRTATGVVGDDIRSHAMILPVQYGNPPEILLSLLRQLGRGYPVLARVRLIARALGTLAREFRPVTTAHCEAGQLLAGQLGLGPDLQRGLGQVYERWDGAGLPHGLTGEAIAKTVRVVQVAHDATIMHRLGGLPAAVAAVRRHSGGAHDPTIAAHFCREAERLLASGEAGATWAAVLASEPGPRPVLSPPQIDTAARTMGDFADLKSPYLTGHSRGVAALAVAAARQCRLPAADVVAIGRSGLLHDIGRVGVSTGIWEKPGPLTDDEWEHVRLHPYLAERVLARAALLAPLGELAALHHERLDGSGYHRGASASQLPMAARLLAAADSYQAMTEPRPYRPARAAEVIADELRAEVRAGRLDGEAVAAVLVAAGRPARAPRRAWAAGLSEREIEVLRLVARGHSDRQMARLLSISERTVHHHVEHIYDKLGVSTRAAATLHAMRHGLLGDADEPIADPS